MLKWILYYFSERDCSKLFNSDQKSITINRLERIVNCLSYKISVPRRLLPTYNKTRDGAHPHIEIDSTGNYNYIVVEKGSELNRDITNNLDELLYWIFKSITSNMAMHFELKNRINNQDTRKLYFNKQIELLTSVNEKWRILITNELNQIIEKSPFDDEWEQKLEYSQKLRNINPTIQEKVESWLENINSSEKPNPEIIAFNFGLFESENGFIMYLIGSKEYNGNDDDWTSEIDFEPKSKYFEFPIIVTGNKYWDIILEISKSILTDYCQSEKYEHSIFKNSIAITIGFDDGELERII